MFITVTVPEQQGPVQAGGLNRAPPVIPWTIHTVFQIQVFLHALMEGQKRVEYTCEPKEH